MNEPNLHRDNAAEVVMRVAQWIVNKVVRFVQKIGEPGICTNRHE
ncbi:MAG: hypothetical protein ACTHLN_16105 [Tepidisphaeraceae bacterium]